MKPICDKIMIVDDDPMVLETLKIMLEDYEYKLYFAQSGSECLEALRKGFGGLVFMDVMMPAMDGWQTIHSILEQDLLPGNAICMLTAVGDPDANMHDLAQYVWDYVRKPCRQEELVEVIQSAMEMLHAAE